MNNHLNMVLHVEDQQFRRRLHHLASNGLIHRNSVYGDCQFLLRDDGVFDDYMAAPGDPAQTIFEQMRPDFVMEGSHKGLGRRDHIVAVILNHELTQVLLNLEDGLLILPRIKAGEPLYPTLLPLYHRASFAMTSFQLEDPQGPVGAPQANGEERSVKRKFRSHFFYSMDNIALEPACQ